MHLALFDFDHTLTTTDCFTAFLKRHLEVSKPSLKLFELALKKQLYKLGWYSATKLRQQAAFSAFQGKQTAVIGADAQVFIRDFIQFHLNAQIVDKLRWHQQQGHTVVVVSASLDVYLRPWCEQMQVDLLCSELAVQGGKYTGNYQSGDCCGQAKADKVQQAYVLTEYERIYAYGDSQEDMAMLKLAYQAYLNGNKLRLVNKVL